MYSLLAWLTPILPYWLARPFQGAYLPLFTFEVLGLVGFWMLLVLVARSWPTRFNTICATVASLVMKASEGRLRPYLIVAGVALGCCVIWGWLRPPTPYFHDEFVYLLGGDTFARGRVTNPTHPMWPHFESIHQLVRPTYAPKYPPGQSLVLALGQVLTGRPVWGVWFSYIGAMVALLWMLRGGLPHHWALFGALMATINGKLLKYWAMTFFGGAFTMLGGALVFGSLLRLWKRWDPANALSFACGVVILFNTRPYEGGIVTFLLAGVIFLSALFRHSTRLVVVLRRLLAPVAVILAGLTWIGYHNLKVTGDPLKLPYSLYNETYEITRAFLIQPQHQRIPEVVWHQPVVWLEEILFETSVYEERRGSLRGFVKGVLVKTDKYARFYVGFVGLIPFFFFLRKRKTWPERAAIWVIIGAWLGTWICQMEMFHYLAPITCLIVFVLTMGLKTLLNFPGWSTLARRVLVGAIVLTHAGESAVAAALYVYRTPSLPHYETIVTPLQNDVSQQHLILVRYEPWHTCLEEWVYNGANIDGQHIVWAKDLGPEKDRALLQYYRNRKIWLFEPDRNPTRLKALN